MAGEAESSFAEEVLDDVLPEGFDWRAMVCSYPLPALAISAVGGFFLGRKHGTAILEALSSFTAQEVDRTLSAFLGSDDDESGDRDD